MSSNIKFTGNISLPYQQNGYAHKCFPVRNIRRFKSDDGGAWLVEYKAEKERRLDVLQQENDVNKNKPHKIQKKVKEFTGSFLIKEFHLDNPSGLFSVNVNGKQLHSSKDESFSSFGNVLYIEAGDNQLNFESFRSFPKLEELHLQVNSITDIIVSHEDFKCLKRLDLSYNQLKDDALLNLGKLRCLKELTLRGCGLKNMHPALARAYLVDDNEQKSKAVQKSRFPELEHLDLSENKLTELSTFASLAGLRKLKTLNLSSNKICGVPNLRLLVSHRHFSASTICTCRSLDNLPPVSETVTELPEEASIAKITKAKEFCEINSGQVVDLSTTGVISDDSNASSYTGIGEARKIVPKEVEGFVDNRADDVNVEDDAGHSSVVNESLDEMSGNEHAPESTKSNDVSDDEENIDDIDECLDIPDEIDFDNLDSFSRGILEVSIANKTPMPVNDSTDADDTVENVVTDLSRQSTAVDIKDDSAVVNISININKSSEIATDSPSSHISDDNLKDSVEQTEFKDESTKLSNKEPSGVDHKLLTPDLAKEINFCLGYNSEGEIRNSGDDVIDSNLKIPFPSLKMLDVSNNLIMEEAGLLALTSWPVLQDLKLWGNPLIQSCKGIPPVISHHLHKMCGINVHRKTPQSDHIYYPIGPSIAKSAKAYRVKNDLPPIKKNTMLMIEAEIRKAVEEKDRKENGRPSIDTDIESYEVQNNVNTNEEIEDANESEGIFLTQVNEDTTVPYAEQVMTGEQVTGPEIEDCPRYQGYEELLKIDETYEPESDILVPSTLCGSVQALRHMLKNPLIFKEGNYNRRRLKPPERKKKIKTASIGKKKDEVIENALDVIRTKETTYHENLAIVLDKFGKNSEMKEKFPDAKKIVKRVQEKYDKVRLESLRPISAAQAELSRMSTRADKHSQDLILLRMKQGKIGDMYSGRSTSIPRSRVSTRNTSRTAP